MVVWRQDWARPSTILLVTGEEPEAGRLKAFLESAGKPVVWVHSREAAVNVLDRAQVDALIARLRAPRIQGMAVLELARKRNPDIGAILLLSGEKDDEEPATRAMARGVIDFQSPPLNLEKIGYVIDRIIERQRLVEDLSRLSQRLDHKFGFPNLIGNSGAMARLRSQLKEIAPLEVRVLIVGEQGSGKDLVAAIIHENSPRRNGPFVRADCSALPPRRLARELFGTPSRGGRARRAGRLELASEGTLYLDGVLALPRDLQARIAEVLRTGQLRPEIGSLPLEIRPRVIASSELDPSGQVEEGSFDEGFHELLSEVSIELSPLRHRRRDIAPLARHFLSEAGEEQAKPLSFRRSALDRLTTYDWPGNVRGLKGVVRGLASHLPAGTSIGAVDLPADIREVRPREGIVSLPLGMSLAEAEQRLIRETLKLCAGNRERAAGVLGIGVRTLYRKIKAYHAGERESEGP